MVQAIPPAKTAELAPRNLTAVVARNSAFVMGAQISMKALAFVFNVYVVRRLGDVHYGKYSAAMAYVTIFAIFTDLGMAPYAVRELARKWERAGWFLPNMAVLRLLLSFLVVIVSTGSAYLLGKEPDMVLGIFIASCGLFLYAIQGPLDAALVSQERLDYSSVFQLVHQVMFIGLGAVALFQGLGFLGLLGVSLLGVAAMAVLSGNVVLRKLKLGRLQLTPRQWPGLLKASWPFGVGGIADAFASRFDTVVLSFALTDAAVGWYNVSYNLVFMLLPIAQAFAMSLYPSLARETGQGVNTIRGIVRRAIKYLLVASLPMAVGLTVLADKIIIFLYTEEFASSIPAVYILAWVLPCLFLSEMLGRTTNVVNRERDKARLEVISASISVVLNLVLVPTMGLLGAALATLIGRFSRVILFWRLLGSDLLVGDQSSALVRLGLVTVLMGSVVFLLREANLFLAIGAGALTYVVLLFALRVLDKAEMAYLTRLVMRKAD